MKPNYEILAKESDCMVIKDMGPWDKHRTITNGVEEVIAELLQMLQGRRLLYFDSEGDLAEILIKDGKFAGFKPL